MLLLLFAIVVAQSSSDGSRPKFKVPGKVSVEPELPSEALFPIYDPAVVDGLSDEQRQTLVLAGQLSVVARAVYVMAQKSPGPGERDEQGLQHELGQLIRRLYDVGFALNT